MEYVNKVFDNSVQRITETLGNRKDLGKLGQVAAASLATYFVASKLYDAFLGPLSSIPGPLMYKFFNVRLVTDLETPPGTSWIKFMEFQKKYGEVGRLGPDHIIIANKDMLKQVLQKDDLPKGKTYERIQTLTGSTMFSSVDKDFHKQRRRAVSPAFALKYINSLEPYMVKTTESLVQRIDRDIVKNSRPDGYGVVDIWQIFQCLALDIIGETAFGSTFHMLEDQDHMVPRTINKYMSIAHYVGAHPFTGPLKLLFNAKSLFASDKILRAFITKTITERIEGGKDARRNDILQILIDTMHATDVNDRLTIEAIATETVLFLVAGSETTGSTIGFAFIRLLSNPAALKALREEIDAVEMEEGQTLFNHSQLKDLPYLNAVISETLRTDTVSTLGLDRIADRDLVLGGRLFIPKGTSIHCNLYHAHFNPEYWPEPDKFLPERWLPGSKIPADTGAYFPFSAGSRNCIGKAFAQLEMRLCIANLIRRYDFEAIPEELVEAEDRRNFLTLTVGSHKFNAKMKLREQKTQ